MISSVVFNDCGQPSGPPRLVAVQSTAANAYRAASPRIMPGVSVGASDRAEEDMPQA
ncbi:hypothetical protein [Caulobacter sp.]|uniref:hypothetical protein n=1 Tax=Caulobacter sp. TaxID=78 RepID=UPI001612D940